MYNVQLSESSISFSVYFEVKTVKKDSEIGVSGYNFSLSVGLFLKLGSNAS